MYKKLILLAAVTISTLNFSLAQNMAHKHAMNDNNGIKNITLEQTKGEFSVQALTLSAGTYQFEIVNNNVGVDVGFVLAPVNSPDQHIKEAYVTEVVKNNSSQKTNLVDLSPGEYVYFCPLNKTPQYTLTVK